MSPSVSQNNLPSPPLSASLKSQSPPPTSPKSPPTPLPRIACLWLPNWPIQRIVVSQPELRRQRLVLFRQDSRRGRLVEAASPLAMLDGVRAAMPLSEAKSLLQRGISKPLSPLPSAEEGPGVRGESSTMKKGSITDNETFFIFEHDPAADRVGLENLANSLSHFSPIIGIEQLEAAEAKQGEQPSSILLDISGLDRLWGSETELARELWEYIQQLDYLPRLAIANTLGMAWGMSRFGASQVASPLASGSSCFIMPADDQQAFLQLPVESLRLPPGIVTTLKELGIKQNHQLWRLSRSDLAMRFGDQIHRRIDQATGSLTEPIIAQQRQTEFTATQSLEYPTQHRETIEVIIGRLVLQICQQLRARQHGGLQWLVNLSLVDQPPIQIKISMFQASSNCAEVMPLIEMQMEQHWGGCSSSGSRESQKGSDKGGWKGSRKRNASSLQVQEVQVSVLSATLLVPQQRHLFDENPRLDRQALAQLINRLTSRLGASQVVYPQLQSGAQPEYSYRFRPLVDVRARRRQGARPALQSHVVGRPLRIFNPPLAIEFTSQASRNDWVFSELQTMDSGSVSPHPLPLSLKGRGEMVTSERADRLTSKRVASERVASERVASFFEIPSAGEGPGVRGNVNQHRSASNHQQPTINQQPTTIINTCGPERIETGWWRGMTVCRDYWRVETSDGRSLWIYRDLREKNWFLQGEF